MTLASNEGHCNICEQRTRIARRALLLDRRALPLVV
jgi:hypothetical protein